jgi:hypothetical protein
MPIAGAGVTWLPMFLYLYAHARAWTAGMWHRLVPTEFL